ncbi:DUF1918 domain-containing protein [Streptacidiphilus sp. EB129]|uniref:DUF1918 domain-containing protein n=1 Tax=Streptacidiphilus sp. EB129 TaxID=3156262 RepID=UPI003512CEF7
MKATIGDQVLVESSTTGRARRCGEVVGLHHEDGTPPYDVRWTEDGHVSLLYPGPDTHIEHPRRLERT